MKWTSFGSWIHDRCRDACEMVIEHVIVPLIVAVVMAVGLLVFIPLKIWAEVGQRLDEREAKKRLLELRWVLAGFYRQQRRWPSFEEVPSGLLRTKSWKYVFKPDVDDPEMIFITAHSRAPGTMAMASVVAHSTGMTSTVHFHYPTLPELYPPWFRRYHSA